MKKIPTIFDRDWDGDRSQVLAVPNGEAQWVFDGEGVPTVKLDGTSCMVRDGTLFKRREVRAEDLSNKPIAGFEVADHDITTGKIVGWVPVGDGPEDRWHREAFKGDEPDGTYELIGPKVQGNPYEADMHRLAPHSSPDLVIEDMGPRTFNRIRNYLAETAIEGIVFHHPDGRMAKIKARDFGLSWPRP